MRSLSLEVPAAKGEEVRRRLQELGRLRKDLRIRREGDRLYLPISAEVALGYPMVEREFPEGYVLVTSYRDLLALPPRLEPLLPRAFDAIGDIVVLRLPEELNGLERQIGDAILRWN